MSDAPPLSITFDLEGEAAAITRRAAAGLHLTIVDLEGPAFRVELNEPYDAFRLATQSALDPAWPRVFIGRPSP